MLGEVRKGYVCEVLMRVVTSPVRLGQRMQPTLIRFIIHGETLNARNFFHASEIAAIMASVRMNW